MIDISKAIAISDYDCQERRDELTWLAEQASKRRRIIEIGSYKGCTARAIADNTSGHVTCIDTFKGSVGEVEMAKILAEHEEGWLEREFVRNMQDLDNWDALVTTSMDAATFFLGEDGFDMIFLDASHDYESVKADIQAWLLNLAPGGLLCGHDRSWDGVKKAIDELVPNHRVGAGAIWYRP